MTENNLYINLNCLYWTAHCLGNLCACSTLFDEAPCPVSLPLLCVVTVPCSLSLFPCTHDQKNSTVLLSFQMRSTVSFVAFAATTLYGLSKLCWSMHMSHMHIPLQVFHLRSHHTVSKGAPDNCRRCEWSCWKLVDWKEELVHGLLRTWAGMGINVIEHKCVGLQSWFTDIEMWAPMA